MQCGVHCLRFAENAAGNGIGPEGRATFETEIIGLPVEIAKRIEIVIFRHVDRLGNCLIHIGLQRRLHLQVPNGRYRMGADECRRQRIMRMILLPNGEGIIRDRIFGAISVLLQYPPCVTMIEHRFQSAGNIIGHQTDAARRGDSGKMAVANALLRNAVAYRFR